LLSLSLSLVLKPGTIRCNSRPEIVIFKQARHGKPFHASHINDCTIQNVPPPPAGAVAVVHTHPIMPTERVKVASCVDRFLDKARITDPEEREQFHESGLRYSQEPSERDIEYAKAHNITSYYLDGTLIEQYYDGTTNQQVTKLESRCGY